MQPKTLDSITKGTGVLFTSFSERDPHVLARRKSSTDTILISVTAVAGVSPYDAYHQQSAVVPYIISVPVDGTRMTVTACSDWDLAWRRHGKVAPLHIGDVCLDPPITDIISVRVSPAFDFKVVLAVTTRDQVTCFLVVDTRLPYAWTDRVSRIALPARPDWMFVDFVTTAACTVGGKIAFLALQRSGHGYTSTATMEYLTPSQYLQKTREVCSGVRGVQFDPQRNLLHTVKVVNGDFHFRSYAIAAGDAEVPATLVACAALSPGKPIDASADAPVAPGWVCGPCDASARPFCESVTVITPCALPTYVGTMTNKVRPALMQPQTVLYCCHMLTNLCEQRRSWITIVNGRPEIEESKQASFNATTYMDGQYTTRHTVTFSLFEPLSLLFVMEDDVRDKKNGSPKKLQHVFKLQEDRPLRFLWSQTLHDETLRNPFESAMQLLVSTHPRMVYNMPFEIKVTSTCVSIRRIGIRFGTIVDVFIESLKGAYDTSVAPDMRQALECCARGAIRTVASWPYSATGQLLDPDAPAHDVDGERVILHHLRALMKVSSMEVLSTAVINDWLAVYASSVGLIDVVVTDTNPRGTLVTARDLVPAECQLQSKVVAAHRPLGANELNFARGSTQEPALDPLSTAFSTSSDYGSAGQPSITFPHMRRVIRVERCKGILEPSEYGAAIYRPTPKFVDLHASVWSHFKRFNVNPRDAYNRCAAGSEPRLTRQQEKVLAQVTGFSELALLARCGSATNEDRARVKLLASQHRHLAFRYVQRASLFPKLLADLCQLLAEGSPTPVSRQLPGSMRESMTLRRYELLLQLRVIVAMHRVGLPIAGDALIRPSELAIKYVHRRVNVAMERTANFTKGNASAPLTPPTTTGSSPESASAEGLEKPFIQDQPPPAKQPSPAKPTPLRDQFLSRLMSPPDTISSSTEVSLRRRRELKNQLLRPPPRPFVVGFR